MILKKEAVSRRICTRNGLFALLSPYAIFCLLQTYREAVCEIRFLLIENCKYIYTHNIFLRMKLGHRFSIVS